MDYNCCICIAAEGFFKTALDDADDHDDEPSFSSAALSSSLNGGRSPLFWPLNRAATLALCARTVHTGSSQQVSPLSGDLLGSAGKGLLPSRQPDDEHATRQSHPIGLRIFYLRAPVVRIKTAIAHLLADLTELSVIMMIMMIMMKRWCVLVLHADAKQLRGRDFPS